MMLSVENDFITDFTLVLFFCEELLTVAVVASKVRKLKCLTWGMAVTYIAHCKKGQWSFVCK